MLKLMKYEFRKTMFSKIILLVITAAAEAMFLIGIFLSKDNLLATSVGFLTMCAIIGIFYIGVESLVIFHRELNTKQSYMLFLTPKSSYEVLGAKVLENGISILVTGAFFVVLASLDVTIAMLQIGGLKAVMEMLHQFMQVQFNINIRPDEIVMVFASGIIGWLLTIVTGDFAIVLSATVFAGKKFSGLVSFGIFVLISWAVEKLTELVPKMSTYNLRLMVMMIVSAGLICVVYAVTGWIMEKKLSV